MATILEDLENRFTYHPPPDQNTALTYEEIRAQILDLAVYLVDMTPASREQSLALTKLEETMFWANAAVARNPESAR